MNKFASTALSLALALTALAPAVAPAGASTAPPAKMQMRGWHRVCNQYHCWWVRNFTATATPTATATQS
jgi:hypothetical protein